jgi:glycosyltransferase involved in cell wall biosynthesis
MKKILIVTDAWYPQVNGVVRVMDMMRRKLEARGYEVVVAEPGLFKSIPFFFYPEVPMVLFPGAAIKEVIDREKPDYVHIATEWTLGFAARNICKRRGIPFTTSYHTNFPRYLPHYIIGGATLLSMLSRWYMRWFHNAAHAVMVSTDTLKEELDAQRFKHVVVWPFGVDAALFSRIAEPDVPPLPGPVFVYFGRIAREKSVEEFLALDLPGTKLVIGDGPERARLEAKYGAKNRFIGYRHGHDLIEWLSACDVFVFPSRTETFGLVILEALALGMPVAAHDVLGPKDIIENGVDGILSENLGEAALKCLSLPKEACRKKALAYSWDRSADVFEAHMKEYR